MPTQLADENGETEFSLYFLLSLFHYILILGPLLDTASALTQSWWPLGIQTWPKISEPDLNVDILKWALTDFTSGLYPAWMSGPWQNWTRKFGLSLISILPLAFLALKTSIIFYFNFLKMALDMLLIIILFFIYVIIIDLYMLLWFFII